jgi:hypothetical protein
MEPKMEPKSQKMETKEGSRSEPEDPSAAEQVVDKVQDLTEQAKVGALERVHDQIDVRSSQVGAQVSSVAAAIRLSSRQLQGEESERTAGVLEQVADRGDRFGRYLNEASADRILHDVEGFARRQPVLFVGGSAVVGFLASRFLKASSVNRYHGSPAAAGVGRRPNPGPAGPALSGGAPALGSQAAVRVPAGGAA